MNLEPVVSQGSLFRYSFLALPLAFAGLPIYMLAPDFYSVHMQLSLSTLGAGLFMLRFVDAFLDPVLGRSIDRFIGNAGVIGGVACALLCLGFFMLFSPPQMGQTYLGIWFFISVFVVTLGFSALTILYGSVGALWSKEASKQTLITSHREAMTLAGLILSISIPFMLMELLTARTAYFVLILVFFVLVIPFFWCYQSIQREILKFALASDNRNGGDAPVLENQAPKLSMIFLYFSYGISATASALPAVLVVFFVRDYLGSQGFIGLALVIYFLSGALSMPLWYRLAKKVGKLRAWQLSMILAILSFTWVCLLSPGDYLFYALICFTSGIALGAEMALPPAILAEYMVGKSRRSVAQKYSWLTMLSKLSLALAAGVCLPLLGAVGFVAGSINSADSLRVLLLLYGALPGVLKLLALVVTQAWIYKERTSKNYADIKVFSNTRSMPDA